MSDDTVESVVAAAVKAKVQTMMVEALGDPATLVRQLVQEALMVQVKTDHYSSRSETVLTKVVRECVVDEARNAMKQWIDEQRPAIRKELIRRITADKADIAEALIDSLVKAAGGSYSLRVIFKENEE